MHLPCTYLHLPVITADAPALQCQKKKSEVVKKLAFQFLQPALLSALFLYKKDGGDKRFVKFYFYHDVSDPQL